jgi:hypothetical protein
MSLWSLRPLCSVSVRTGELPHASPSLPALWREKMLSYVFFCAGGVAVTSQDFINSGGKKFAFVLLEMFGNSQGFKTFEYIWKLY